MEDVLVVLGMDPARFRRMQIKAGAVIFRETDPADVAYLIDAGVVEISKRTADGEDSTIALLKRGAIFGELALVSNKPRSATAKAVLDSACYVIEKDTFDAMMQDLEPFPRFVLQQVIRALYRLTNIYAQNPG